MAILTIEQDKDLVEEEKLKNTLYLDAENIEKLILIMKERWLFDMDGVLDEKKPGDYLFTLFGINYRLKWFIRFQQLKRSSS